MRDVVILVEGGIVREHGHREDEHVVRHYVRQLTHRAVYCNTATILLNTVYRISHKLNVRVGSLLHTKSTLG